MKVTDLTTIRDFLAKSKKITEYYRCYESLFRFLECTPRGYISNHIFDELFVEAERIKAEALDLAVEIEAQYELFTEKEKREVERLAMRQLSEVYKEGNNERLH